ncbi:MAG: potassium efflux system protein [Gammaproteobacteria bacterium]
MVYVYRLMHRDSAMVKHLGLRYPTALITRFHLLIATIVLVLPVSFALLASIGYYYTALNLNRYLMQTGFLILVVIVVRSLAMRWLILAESRLALKRARERREAARASGENEGESPELSDDDMPIDIATINSQTRMMLSNVIGWSFAVGLYFTWQGALPALGILESINLWEIEVQGVNGTEFQAITLATVLLAGIIVVVTSIAAKNLPGVLEIGLLQRLPLQPGSRYAITTLSQYAITAVGLTIAVSALGARWSQIQWLVAALSVGLGFGLQEIVANFISGLILLFERPIRVGDTVTIGELTGKVARIRIRATTIVDWDNKEIVVPNKNFITERFVNWTLSDPIIRVKVNVGIAYGSDVGKALEVMSEAADAQEKVLLEPPPQALFLGFGDSSLDFEIQLYIRDLSDRLPVIHDIHMAINNGFAEADIEIPFPQRDLHLRSVSPAVEGLDNLTLG